MSEPYIGEIRMVGFNFAPENWALCDGSLLAISQNETLFNLIGTTYGGDGQTTFALPNLLGRVPVHVGTIQGMAFTIGLAGGTETVTLNSSQIPLHTHAPMAVSGGGTSNLPTNNAWAEWTGAAYTVGTPGAVMSTQATTSAGGGASHDNLMPFQVINFVISLFGVYPSQN